jgi:hypothetical protein
MYKRQNVQENAKKRRITASGLGARQDGFFAVIHLFERWMVRKDRFFL